MEKSCSILKKTTAKPLDQVSRLVCKGDRGRVSD